MAWCPSRPLVSHNNPAAEKQSTEATTMVESFCFDYWREVMGEELAAAVAGSPPRQLLSPPPPTDADGREIPAETAATGRPLPMGRGLGGILDGIRQEAIGVTICRESLSPPPLTGDGRAGSWVLLDLKAYIADRANATTASSLTRARHEIRASLCVAAPPRVSHLCVHCPALAPGDFGTEPLIIATADDLILFHAGICNSDVSYDQIMQDFFVYQAAPPKEEGGKGPSLTRLPHPGDPFMFSSFNVGLLRYDGGGGFFLRPHGIAQQHYIIAVLNFDAVRTDAGEFQRRCNLHRFRSGDSKWTTTVLDFSHMPPSPGLTYFCHQSDKVIVLGGGFMGWVDLNRGILLCDVLTDQPELHYIPLPHPLEPSKKSYRFNSRRNSRDIAVVGDDIKYVENETETHVKSWSATVFHWKINFNCWKGEWKEDHTLNASNITGSLSKLLDYKEATPLPALKRLHMGLPKLSLSEDDVVYFLAKVDHRDDKALVLAVDMRVGTLRGADYFGARGVVDIIYTQSRVADYLKIAPG